MLSGDLHSLHLSSIIDNFYTMDQYSTRHKAVYNGGSPNFSWLLFNRNTFDMAQILQNLSYKECFIITKIHHIRIVYSSSEYILHYGPDSLLL